MAINGFLRPGFIQVRVLDMVEAEKHYVDYLGLDKVCQGPDGRVYLKGYDEFDHHSIILREADEAGLDVLGFKLDSEASMESYAQRIRASGTEVDDVPAGEQPGLGRRMGFVIPSGHRVEMYAEAALSDHGPGVDNPDVWKDMPRGMRAMRFDHTLLYGPDIDKTLAFFTDVLDFKCAEKVVTPDGPLAIFLTCSNKAHDLAFVMNPEPGKLHHVSFLLESWNDVGNAADIISRFNISLDIGPTRHGITRGQTIYFFDPSGNRNEVFSGGYAYYPDNPTRVWGAEEVGKAIFYYEKELNDRFLSVVT